MSIDFKSPYSFLKTMRFMDYESNSDFFSDMQEQVDKQQQEIESLRAQNEKLGQAEKILLTVFKGLEKGIRTVPDSFPHGDMKFYFRNLKKMEG